MQCHRLDQTSSVVTHGRPWKTARGHCIAGAMDAALHPYIPCLANATQCALAEREAVSLVALAGSAVRALPRAGAGERHHALHSEYVHGAAPVRAPSVLAPPRAPGAQWFGRLCAPVASMSACRNRNLRSIGAIHLGRVRAQLRSPWRRCRQGCSRRPPPGRSNSPPRDCHSYRNPFPIQVTKARP